MEEELEEFIQIRIRTRRDSYQDGTKTLSRNAGFRRRRKSLFTIVPARGARETKTDNSVKSVKISRLESDEHLQ
jgi:hypothetical protein